VLRNFESLAQTVEHNVRTDVPLDRLPRLVKLATSVDPRSTADRDLRAGVHRAPAARATTTRCRTSRASVRPCARRFCTRARRPTTGAPPWRTPPADGSASRSCNRSETGLRPLPRLVGERPR
jgi:hypothetical protein